MSAVVCFTLSGFAHSGDKHDENKRDLHEFIATQGTFCADLLGNGECMLLNAPLNNIFSWTEPPSFRMGYFDYSGIADRAFNGRFGATFKGHLTETELPDGRGLVKLKLHTKNASSWAYIRAPYNPFSQPSDQLFGHWITSDYSVVDGFVSCE